MYYPKCNGRWTGKGFTFIETIVLISVIIFAIALIMLALRYVRGTYRLMTCGTNLVYINFAMLNYANDYEDELPRAGGKDTVWGCTVRWDAIDRIAAYGLEATGTGGAANITSSFYLLVKYAEVTPKTFICKGDIGAVEFKLTDYPSRNPAISKLTDAWDFGGEPRKHCSYSYHIPYGLYALTSSSEPGMAVAADRNPWIATPSKAAKIPYLFKPDIPPWNGTAKQARYGNAVTHKGNGQNILFMDSHVDFKQRAFCGINDDNIYTLVEGGIGYVQLGTPPMPFSSQPGSRRDSLLVHDPPASRGH